MHHGHSHDPDHAHASAGGSALRAALAITAAVMLLEAVGGVLTGSVALLADAGHMLTDVGALSIALLAAWIAARPRTPQMSFGYGRAEIVAALINGVLLGGVSVGVAVESIQRLLAPGAIRAGPMIAIACVGLVANIISAALLSGSARDNLNVRGAWLHVLGDALGSIAAIGAGVAVWLWGWTRADGVAGLAIAVLLVIGATRLIRASIDVLLERVPEHLDLERIAGEICELPGVTNVHDLHIWELHSGFLAMSGHVDVDTQADPEAARRAVHRLLHERYDIAHTTIQTEQAPLLHIQPPPAETQSS